MARSSNRAPRAKCSPRRPPTTPANSWRRFPGSAAPIPEPLLSVRGLEVAYGSSTVVHGVDFEIPTRPFGLALVGESGSGKTTIARALLRLHPTQAGAIKVGESDLLGVGGAELKQIRRSLQVVFQDSDAALDPRLRVGRSVAEALRTHHVVGRSEETARVATLLEEVGLDGELARRYPHQLSGGQRQRVGIARALATEPELMILDEPTSALDVTVQATILRLFARLREERSLAYLLISHNLAVVDQLCERIVVLYRGRVVERGETRTILRRPAHPYTQALRRAVPELGVEAPTRLASPTGPAPATGCPYAHRCALVIDRCREAVPELARASNGSEAACIRIDEALAGWDAEHR